MTRISRDRALSIHMRMYQVEANIPIVTEK